MSVITDHSLVIEVTDAPSQDTNGEGSSQRAASLRTSLLDSAKSRGKGNTAPPPLDRFRSQYHSGPPSPAAEALLAYSISPTALQFQQQLLMQEAMAYRYQVSPLSVYFQLQMTPAVPSYPRAPRSKPPRINVISADEQQPSDVTSAATTPTAGKALRHLASPRSPTLQRSGRSQDSGDSTSLPPTPRRTTPMQYAYPGGFSTVLSGGVMLGGSVPEESAQAVEAVEVEVGRSAWGETKSKSHNKQRQPQTDNGGTQKRKVTEEKRRPNRKSKASSKSHTPRGAPKETAKPGKEGVVEQKPPKPTYQSRKPKKRDEGASLRNTVVSIT